MPRFATVRDLDVPRWAFAEFPRVFAILVSVFDLRMSLSLFLGSSEIFLSSLAGGPGVSAKVFSKT